MKKVIVLLLLSAIPWSFAVAQTTPLAPCTLSDIDRDDNGLIEICDLEGLDAIRYQLNGTGYKANSTATKITAGCPSSGCRGYELTRSLDFQDNSSYRDAAAHKEAWTVSDYTDTADQGWQPIGESNTVSFNTTLQGNNHTISNLMINRIDIDQVGLFGYARSNSRIVALSLLNVDIRGQDEVGGLIGFNWPGSVITNSSVTGSVIGRDDVGGLVGDFGPASRIIGSFVDSRVVGRNGVGGLVGSGVGDITSSHAAGSVEGVSGVGGLVGRSFGHIVNSYADVNVKGNYSVGGLVGTSYNKIMDSYATGDVEGIGGVGGLVGDSEGDIMNSYATGGAEGYNGVGGLAGVGINIKDSHATGDAEGVDVVGGLVGESRGDITNSYATGGVEGVNGTGGLVGVGVGNIKDSYAAGGRVEGEDGVGGLVGIYSNTQKTIINSTATNSVTGRQNVGGLVGIAVGLIANGKAIGNVQGEVSVGGLVGWGYGAIRNSYATGSVQGEVSVGGLVGLRRDAFYRNGDDITDSYATGSVEGNDNTGGLVGESRGDIMNSYATGSVEGNDNTGGLIGESRGDIMNSYATGSVEGNDNTGGLVGYSRGDIMNSYATGSVEGNDNTGGLVGDGRNDITSSYATGSVEGNDNTGGLVGLSDNNIRNSYALGDVIGRTISTRNLTGVGGLVGTAIRGEIINSYATGDIDGNNVIGGLVGSLSGCNIRNSYANGDVKGNSSIGGLVGTVQGGEITNSYATGKVSGRDNRVGGLIGFNFGASITNSYATGDIDGNHVIGGLVGSSSWCSIRNSYASGDIKGKDSVGGLVGMVSLCGIRNSYTTGSVEGNSNVGGLIGQISGNVTNSYATGSVEGKSNVGGLIGRAISGHITASYWDTETSGITTSTIGEGKTTAELQSPTTATGIYSSWSDTAWDFGTTIQYPRLRWDTDNWDFGTPTQNPALKYTKGSDADNPACGSTAGLPSCDTILSDQRVGLLQLRLSENAIFSPPFNSKVYDYQIISSFILKQLRLLPIAAKSTAAIVVRASSGFRESVDSGTTSSVIPLNVNAATVIVIEVDAENERPLQYTLVINSQSYDEGEPIVLDGAANRRTESSSLSYRWSQEAGLSLLPQAGIEQAILDVEIPPAFVARTSTDSEIILGLRVSNGDVVIDNRSFTLRIVKVDNGSADISSSITVQNSILTAPDINLSEDPDGVGMTNDHLWQRRLDRSSDWVDIEGEVAKTYRLPANTKTYTEYRVLPSYSDGQGYLRRLESGVFVFAVDIDKDNDGLIEIDDLEGLHAMRYQLDGSGYRANEEASKITVGCKAGGCKGYELTRDLDFELSESYRGEVKDEWTMGLGWQPLGTSIKPFNSIFNANNNTIANLHINRDSADESVGLFGVTGGKAEIIDVGLLAVDIVGNDSVGGLVGHNTGGIIDGSYVTGRVSGEGMHDVGGLVGWHQGGIISDSYANSIVVGSGTNSGGLVGDNDGGTITNSYATGRVVGNENSGGLVGVGSRGVIAQSYAEVEVEGSGAVGGLVGKNVAMIMNSYAIGRVKGGADVGSMVGWNSGDISNSYALGDVEGNNAVGGLVGNNLRGAITNSYARGNVVGVNQYIGGLVGWNGVGVITNSYAHGDVLGDEDIGGLVGVNLGRFNNVAAGGIITKSYAVGNVRGNEENGGLVGDNRHGTVMHSYWNKTNNPTQVSAGGTSKTTVELQSAVIAGSTETEIYYAWSSDDWDFASPMHYPLLRYAVGADEHHPACGDADDLPTCGALLTGQLPVVGLTQLSLSDGAILLPAFSPEVHHYRVNIAAATTHLRMGFSASDGEARVRITSDGGFTDNQASSGTRVPLNSERATVITLEVTAQDSTPSVYKLYINRRPEIVLAGVDTETMIKEGREHTLNVRVSDADTEDVLTLLLSAVGEGQDKVALITTSVEVSTNGNALRDEQTLTIKGLKAGEVILKLMVADKDAVSEAVFIMVVVEANAAPMIEAFVPMSVIEGEVIDAAAAVSDANHDELEYHWRAWRVSAEEDEEEISIEDSAAAIFVVPTDLVDASVTAATLRIRLVVSDGMESVSTMTSVLVIKKNNGVATAGALRRDGAELSLPTIDLSDDPDGGGTSATYLWQRCASDCVGEDNWEKIGDESDTPTVYTMTANEVSEGVRFRVKVVYRDGQGYEETIFYNSGIRIRAKVFLEGLLP